MKYFQTSDKKLFYVEDLARNHARSLKDKTVKKVDSTDLKSESKSNKTAQPKAVKPASKKETLKEVNENKTGDSKKEDLETEVNQDKKNSSDVDATQKVDEVKETEESKNTK